MKLINWVELHLNHINLIFPFLGGIFEFITTAILINYDTKFELNNHPFASGINAGIGMSLVMVPYYFIKTHARKRDMLMLGRKYRELSHKRNQPNVKRQRYLIFFLCAFLDFIKKLIEFIFSKQILSHIWIYNIIFISCFNYMIAKNKLYKHQYFSLCVIVFFGTVLNIIFMHSMKVNEIPLLILAILVESIYSLLVVLGKFGLDNRYCSPFVLTFCEGFLSLIFNIIFIIIASNEPLSVHFKYKYLIRTCEYKGKKYLDNFNGYMAKLSDFNEILFFFVTMSGKCIFSLFSHITTRYYTSSHVMIILIIGKISVIMKPMETYQRVMASIIYFIEFVMIFIYCELVELKCCGLQQNIKRNIEEKQKEELFNKEDEEHAEQDMWDGLELNSDSQSSDHNVSFEIA